MKEMMIHDTLRKCGLLMHTDDEFNILERDK